MIMINELNWNNVTRQEKPVWMASDNFENLLNQTRQVTLRERLEKLLRK